MTRVEIYRHEIILKAVSGLIFLLFRLFFTLGGNRRACLSNFGRFCETLLALTEPIAHYTNLHTYLREGLPSEGDLIEVTEARHSFIILAQVFC